VLIVLVITDKNSKQQKCYTDVRPSFSMQ